MGTLLASGVNAIAMVATVPLMERAGRRRLLLVGISGMLFSALGLTGVLIARDSSSVDLGEDGMFVPASLKLSLRYIPM